ncbi:hypothetical protein GCM10025878_11380 [Leuconostoc gasicomitatum]|uniref:Membrane-fusion protein n=2 Tax=Leuconostoc TaxID=1243 RepID=A0AAN2QUZ0_9LACO|nr:MULTISPECIES: hypothetical protein [Leuconostoc]MBZ5957724.1 hypothetical protein [Leuconostoc gasicomitatum]MBZ5958910.1 hypothetical protein [Leuconostoc gasicomitatum]MBZ5965958.1 hypothetical protein [Leuconostoc gasicomitatum]MBZ5980503.1 hypothetical protein [Leuconostoc gasicomitatum]MBZ5981931.1 hypothetical protein [Leuconostoc gasicomitatum]
MPTKIWLKPEQLELYIKQLERFRDLYSQLDQTLESDRQGFQFKAGAPNFQTTLSVSMQLHTTIRQAQSQTYSDVLFFNNDLAKRVQDLVEKSIAITFAYRDLDLLIKGTDRTSDSGLNKIEEQLYQAKKQLRERS